ncbi:D-tyrosyl-tRNA(Tyr) deacylase [candidate division NPL-UPA2 bacterium]|nr:D-tyrosyl-tRNA(Tyr) deacylase [candidate division NPL-UPA2 bacterium]
MKALLQVVSEASVSVRGETVNSINRGIVALVGVKKGDLETDAQYLAEKMANLRIFPDEKGKFNLSLLDIKGEILVISQFTLLADANRGRRPSFTDAAPSQEAEPLIEKLVQHLKEKEIEVKTGRFREHMLVRIHNDGPMTIMIESKH